MSLSKNYVGIDLDNNMIEFNIEENANINNSDIFAGVVALIRQAAEAAGVESDEYIDDLKRCNDYLNSEEAEEELVC